MISPDSNDAGIVESIAGCRVEWVGGMEKVAVGSYTLD